MEVYCDVQIARNPDRVGACFPTLTSQNSATRLKMPPYRTIKITVRNETSGDFTLEQDYLNYGKWTLNKAPPQTIAANDSAWFQCESVDIVAGTQGNVTYESSAGQFNLAFDNPFAGGNSYDQTMPAGLNQTRDGGSGDDAEVTWTIS